MTRITHGFFSCQTPFGQFFDLIYCVLRVMTLKIEFRPEAIRNYLDFNLIEADGLD